VLIPIYQEQGKTYEADTCRDVVRAVEAGQLQHMALCRGHYPGFRLPRNALPGVKCVGFWDADHRQDWGLDWHRNEGLELTFLESGRLGFAVDGRDSLLQAGDLTVTRPWQQHRVGDPQIAPGRLHFLILDVGVRRPHQTWRWPAWIVLTTGDLRQLTNILRHNEQPVWHATSEVARSFARIAEDVEAVCQGGSISSLAVHLNQLFLSLLQMFRRQEVHLDQSLSSTRRTVELFWTDLSQDLNHLALEWTVRGMARRCGMGVTNFIHHSKQLVNMTPVQYLNHCRLSVAARLLKEQPNRSITEIAMACGFTSSQYFATLFRRHWGVTPRAYRSSSQTVVLSEARDLGNRSRSALRSE
jgi:AraC-like DNA-binding protein